MGVIWNGKVEIVIVFKRGRERVREINCYYRIGFGWKRFKF